MLIAIRNERSTGLIRSFLRNLFPRRTDGAILVPEHASGLTIEGPQVSFSRSISSAARTRQVEWTRGCGASAANESGSFWRTLAQRVAYLCDSCRRDHRAQHSWAPVSLDFAHFAFCDSGANLSLQYLIAHGYRPTIDFAYHYGLLPIFRRRGYGSQLQGDAGRIPDTHSACGLGIAFAYARIAATLSLRGISYC